MKRFEMVNGLSNIELAKLLGKLDKRHLPAGEKLFEQGDAGDSMYLIESGRIELFSQSDGLMQSLAVLDPGDSLGEMALLTGEQRSATAVAASDALLYRIEQETFDALLAQHASISAYFIRLLSQRLILTNDRLQLSKESKSQWITQRLERLPEHKLRFLLWCAVIPVVQLRLVEFVFESSRSAELMSDSELHEFLELDTPSSQTVRLRDGLPAILSEMASVKYGHQAKRNWLEQAASYYQSEEDWAAVLRIYIDTQNWDAAMLTASHIAGLPLTEEQAADVGGILIGCPDERLLSNCVQLEFIFQHCRFQNQLLGLAYVERALNQESEDHTPQRYVFLYEWGARFAQLLQKKTTALEYLQLAETAALASTQPRQDEESGEREINAAKRKLASRKTQLLAENAGRLVKPVQRVRLLTVLAAVTCVISFHYLPLMGNLSRPAMDFIGIAIAAVMLWIVNIIPDYLVALGMAMLWVLGGLVEPEAALSGFATTTWLFMIFIMALSAAVTKSGILYRFSLHALRRFPPNYRGQLWGIVAGSFALNALIPSSSAKVSLGVPIAGTISESMGFKARSRGAAGLGLAAMIFYGFTAPFVLTGSYTNIMAYGLVSADQPVSWLHWALYALPAFFIFGIVMLLLLSTMFRRTMAEEGVSAVILNEQIRLLGPLSKEERIAVFTILGCILLMILQPLHGIDSTWILMLGFGVLVITGILDKRTLTSGIDWTFLLFLGVAFSFAEVANQLGIVEALSSFLGSPMAWFVSSPTLFLLAVILLSFLVTLVVRDDPAVILLVTALLPLAEQAGIHPWILVFIILLSTDPFFFAYQSPTYLTAYYSSDGKAFSHAQGQKVALGYAAAVLLVAVLCVPYWRWLGLIG